MKKWKRWLALVLAMLLCASLCGCSELETMRKEHAVWQEDGSILWNGVVYHRLENVSSRENFVLKYDQVTIHVTTPDVPVLLSSIFGNGVAVCGDGTLLQYHDYRLDDGLKLYCREDIYAEMVAQLEEGIEIATYFYSVYHYETQQSVTYYLTKEQAEAIRYVLSSVTRVLREYFDEVFVDGFYLSGCDESHRFQQGVQMQLCVTETCYCIEQNGYVYVVPAEYNPIFDEIWQPYREANYGKEVQEAPPSVIVS